MRIESKDDYRIVVIGGSAGSLQPLSALVSRLPRTLPAALFVVKHFSPGGTSLLPLILNRHGQLPARHAVDGEPIEPGRIYVAPPDRHHLLIEPGYIRLAAHAKENRFRPAFDPAFHSAAASYGPRVIGVLLSGMNRDGVAGLRAIQQAGGITIVQDPNEAGYSAMPEAALAELRVDYCLRVEPMAEVIAELAAYPTRRPTNPAAISQSKEVLC